MRYPTRRTSPDGIWLRAVANVTALAGLSGVAATGYIAAIAVTGPSADDRPTVQVRDSGNHTAPPRSGSASTTPARDDDGSEESDRTSGLSPVQPPKTPATPNTSVQGGSNGS